MWTYIFNTSKSGSRRSVEKALKGYEIPIDFLHEAVEYTHGGPWKLKTACPLSEEMLNNFRPSRNPEMAGFTRIESGDKRTHMVFDNNPETVGITSFAVYSKKE